MPARRPFAPGRPIRLSADRCPPAAHSEVPALSPSGLRWPPTPARWTRATPHGLNHQKRQLQRAPSSTCGPAAGKIPPNRSSDADSSAGRGQGIGRHDGPAGRSGTVSHTSHATPILSQGFKSSRSPAVRSEFRQSRPARRPRCNGAKFVHSFRGVTGSLRRMRGNRRGRSTIPGSGPRHPRASARGFRGGAREDQA